MKIKGFVRKQQNGMLSFEIPLLDCQSWCPQTESPAQAAADWVRGVIFAFMGTKIKIQAHMTSKTDFEIETRHIQQLLGLLLQQQRRKAGLSVRDLAKKAKIKSHANIVHYEMGKSEMSLSKLEQLLAPLGLSPSLVIQA